MTNAVDVLLIGGPKHKSMYCAARPVPTNYEAMVPNAGGYNMVTYQHEVFTLAGKHYHIALFDIDEPELSIAAAIVESGHQPAWDLNRAPPPEVIEEA